MGDITFAKAKPTVARIQQEDSATCWLASCKMLYQWAGKPVSEVERLLKAASAKDPRVDLDTWKESGLSHPDLLPLAQTLGFKWGGGGILTAQQLRDAVVAWGPVLAVGCWNSYSHVIVVCGVQNNLDSRIDESQTKLQVQNPAWGYPDPDDKKNMFWFNGGLGHWAGVNGQYMHW